MSDIGRKAWLTTRGQTSTGGGLHRVEFLTMSRKTFLSKDAVEGVFLTTDDLATLRRDTLEEAAKATGADSCGCDWCEVCEGAKNIRALKK